MRHSTPCQSVFLHASIFPPVCAWGNDLFFNCLMGLLFFLDCKQLLMIPILHRLSFSGHHRCLAEHGIMFMKTQSGWRHQSSSLDSICQVKRDVYKANSNRWQTAAETFTTFQQLLLNNKHLLRHWLNSKSAAQFEHRPPLLLAFLSFFTSTNRLNNCFHCSCVVGTDPEHTLFVQNVLFSKKSKFCCEFRTSQRIDDSPRPIRGISRPRIGIFVQNQMSMIYYMKYLTSRVK